MHSAQTLTAKLYHNVLEKAPISYFGICYRARHFISSFILLQMKSSAKTTDLFVCQYENCEKSYTESRRLAEHVRQYELDLHAE